MTAQITDTEQNTSDKILARIDSQDATFILPIQQFLEAHGCRVIIGPTGGDIPLYHIVAGDEFFVKEFFSQHGYHETKRLALVFSNTNENWEDLSRAMGAKIILLPPKIPDARETEAIFAFFFVNHKPVLNLLPQGTVMSKKIPPVSNQIKNTHRENDKDRIAQTMVEIFEEKGTKPHDTKRPRKHERRLHALFVAFFLLIAPLAWYLVSFAVSIGTLAIASQMLANGNVRQATQATRVSKYWIYQGKGTLAVVGFPIVGLGRGHVVRQQEKLWSIFADLQKGIEGALSVVEDGQVVAQTILVSTLENSKNFPGLAGNIERIRSDIFLLRNHLGFAQAQLGELIRQHSFPFSISIIQKVGERTQKRLAALRTDAETMDNLLSLYQKIGGFTEKKTYLLLFQNSMELRPTGGFIGSVGLATLSEGKILDLQIQDVYTVDGQLKGHVDPPTPIAEFLGQEHWYLRDSNWDPDFGKSGERAAWFYEKETGVKVDGVIAINVPVIDDLLFATGPIELGDYNDRITAENFFGKSLYYTQSGFFPGSTQKKDFLGTLAHAIITKLTTQKGTDPLLVFRAITQGLQRHDVLFFLKDPQLSRLVASLEWGGVVPGKQICESYKESCLFDYFAIVDANVSVNKVNYFVKRDIVRQVTIEESGAIAETILISYKNTSVGDSGGGGQYRNYARFYIPSDIIIGSITLDGQVVRSKKEEKDKPALLPYKQNEGAVEEMMVMAVVFDVPAGSERRMVISYQRQHKLVFGKNGALLELFTQRQ
ncbi:DUF4012 domain-containing protein, partial [Candidatus Gottesmanbacteria bacterium]|nr:DUF4012 domain-containing protein [Candidatus Gottesmanbacteria bacterium]